MEISKRSFFYPLTLILLSVFTFSSCEVSINSEPVFVEPQTPLHFEVGETNSYLLENVGGNDLSACHFNQDANYDLVDSNIQIQISSDGSTCEIYGSVDEVIDPLELQVYAISFGEQTPLISVTIVGGYKNPTFNSSDRKFYYKDQIMPVLELINLGSDPLIDCSSENLPQGLLVTVSIDSKNCEISGTPVEVQVSELTEIIAKSSDAETVIPVYIEIAESVPFITTWQTDLQLVSGDLNKSLNNQLTIFANQEWASDNGYQYLFDINWGDGNTDSNVSDNITHTYEQAGVYTLEITGSYPVFRLIDSAKLLTIDQWGTQKWRAMNSMFYRAENMQIAALDNPDLTLVNNMQYMLMEATQFNSDIGGWDLTSVSITNRMFARAKNFNQDISNWDVSNITDMAWMFFETYQFDQDLSGWNVSRVEDMEGLFSGSVFNQNIQYWDVSNVANMQFMFSESSFNQDISSWDVSKVSNMRNMFKNASQFDQNIDGWDVSSVINMEQMFYNADNFDQNLSSWDVSNVANMANMFVGSNLSVENYDAILIAWSNLNLQSDVQFDVGATGYSQNAQAARDKLVNEFGWIITDGGLTP